jgi:glycosyltransferase involved in cell wall biosynthesis
MTAAPRLVIITPVHNDWEALAILTARLDSVLGAAGVPFSLIVADDASRSAAMPDRGTILRLTRNVGHQRAIAVALDFALRETDAALIAIMDADGEDRPEDLPALVAALAEGAAGGAQIAVASRRRRSEGVRFRSFYLAYKTAFRVLTGETLDFGNFCVLRREAAQRLVYMHELWLNLPATIMRSRLPMVRLPSDRGWRYAGESRMNLVSLVTHGLSAIGVFSERAFTRVLLAIGGTALFMVLSLVISLGLKAVGLATPGWATTIAAAALIVLVQSAIAALCGLFIVFGQTANFAHAPNVTAGLLVARVDRKDVLF